MAREVYKDGRQFRTEEELREEVFKAAKNFNPDTLINEYDFMLDRCIAVVEAERGPARF